MGNGILFSPMLGHVIEILADDTAKNNRENSSLPEVTLSSYRPC